MSEPESLQPGPGQHITHHQSGARREWGSDSDSELCSAVTLHAGMIPDQNLCQSVSLCVKKLLKLCHSVPLFYVSRTCRSGDPSIVMSDDDECYQVTPLTPAKCEWVTPEYTSAQWATLNILYSKLKVLIQMQLLQFDIIDSLFILRGVLFLVIQSSKSMDNGDLTEHVQSLVIILSIDITLHNFCLLLFIILFNFFLNNQDLNDFS